MATNAKVPKFGTAYCQLAHDYRKLTPLQKSKLVWPCAVEPKLDGIRALCEVRGDRFTFFTREGKLIQSVRHLHQELKPIIGAYDYPFYLDGEMMGPDGFNATSGAVRQHSNAPELTYHVFDIFSDLHKGLNYTHRREHLKALVMKLDSPKVVLNHSTLVYNEEQMLDLYDEYRQMGYEGIIRKHIHEQYQFKRHKSWLKVKDLLSIDLRICGAIEGKGKYVGMLGLLQVEYEGNVVGVGTGFSDQERDILWKLWQNDPRELLRRHIEIGYHELTLDGSLRHPRFYRFRPDLDADRGL